MDRFLRDLKREIKIQGFRSGSSDTSWYKRKEQKRKQDRDSREERTERETDKQKGEDGMVDVNVRNLW